jgi:2-oxoglutarate dehydrogenase E1 component
VNPVVLGKARAKQAKSRRRNRAASSTAARRALPLLLHGDAAFAGQGVVAECFALSGLRATAPAAPSTSSSTTRSASPPARAYSRSSPYPSDVALMVEAPIFHVNGDDPEAVVYAAKVATEYRQKFGKDVVIDMFCYRRFGHNEGDDPTMTQPVMYKVIKDQPSTREIYGEAPRRRGPDHPKPTIAAQVKPSSKTSSRRVRGRQGPSSQQGRLAGRPLVGPSACRRTTIAAARPASPRKLKETRRRDHRAARGLDMHKTVARGSSKPPRKIETGKEIDWGGPSTSRSPPAG